MHKKTICDSDARFRVAVTGRRFGKTHVAMRELARFASKKRKQPCMVCSAKL